MYYGDKREAKVKIMYKLVEAGWKVFGYSPDQSDSMTDYYSPAHWSGIATKNGYVLLIDIGNLSCSGREIRKYNYDNKIAVSNSRIQKLTAMMNDQASTENEKASCAVLIEKELEKSNVEPSYTVEEVYPTFARANPRGTTWHIEKDGQVIAKGKGVFSTNTYDWTNKEVSSEEQKERKINAFIDRIEKVLNNSDALQPVVIKVPVKTIKAVDKEVQEITDADIKEGFTFIMKVAYTHGKSKGNKYTLIHRDDQFNKYHTFSKLGKNNKPSKSIDKTWGLSANRINELLDKGHITVIEFVETVEYEEKTVFKKTARKQSVSTAPAIETTEEAINSDNKENNSVTVKLNEEMNGIELYFSDKPSEEIREQLKANGFRWSKRGFWYAKQTEKTLAYVKILEATETTTASNEAAQEPVTYPEIDIDDLDKYIVSDELQSRLHSASLFSVDYKKDCRITFEQIQNEVLEVLSLTDSQRIQYYIKKYLQSFKRRYYEMYMKIISHRANNPSWAVTGRGGINVRRYNKKQEQYANMINKASDMMNEFNQRIDKFKDEIRREERKAFEADLNRVTSDMNGSPEFITETKELDYMGIKERLRTYNYNGFTIAKTWGCYRVFKNGEEINTNLKTTSKLDDAKRFVLYLSLKVK
ncbi:MAG: hypothetical protein ACQEXX_01795 [Bacillota bacterium]